MNYARLDRIKLLIRINFSSNGKIILQLYTDNAKFYYSNEREIKGTKFYFFKFSKTYFNVNFERLKDHLYLVSKTFKENPYLLSL